MKKARLKYPTKVGSVLFPIGTEVEILNARDPRVFAIFPNMKERRESSQVAVMFPGKSKPCIHAASHVEMIEEEKEIKVLPG